ncbi:MAG: AI-2E family transporter [Bdellovibrionota bacterium]
MGFAVSWAQKDFDKFRCKLSKAACTVCSMAADALNFFKNYVKGQVLLSFVLAILYSLGFGLAGLPWGYLIGFFTGFFSWIPFFGSLVGFFVAVIVVALNFTWPLFLSVFGVYLVIQLLEATFLAPKILGRVVGLGFWQSMAAVLIGAIAFGPLGATLAIPVAAFIKFMIAKRATKEAENNIQNRIENKSE